MKTILVILLSINFCFAGEISIIKKGESAKYSGFLVDKSQMKTFRKINEEKKLSEAKNLVLSDLKLTHEGMIAFHKKRVESAQNELQTQQFKNYLSNIVFFSLGVIATIFIVKNVPK